MQQAMNSVRHGKSTPFEAKSHNSRSAWQGLPCEVVVANLIQPAELSGFKRHVTAVLKSNLILEFSSARQ